MTDGGEVQAVLLGMKEVLVEGWGQGQLFDPSTKANPCLFGGLIKAANLPCHRGKSDAGSAIPGRAGGDVHWQVDLNSAEWRALILIAEALGVPQPHLLALWNDEPGRTQQDVIDVIDGALALLADREAVTV